MRKMTHSVKHYLLLSSCQLTLLTIASTTFMLSSAIAHAESATATIVVATADSSPQSKAKADYVGDGKGDQEEINQAIQRLSETGGTVLLMEGTYDIRRVEGQLGGIIINRSNVVLAGQGTSTKLKQAYLQETNVIRIIGSDVGYITIRDLYIDANSENNPLGEGDPNIAHDRFEYCGIKAYCQRPGQSGAKPNHNITIRNTHVHNARRLGIMLEGSNMKVVNNVIGNAKSDCVEILTGPGEIRGNTFVITGKTHVACGSDRGNSIIMSDNIVHVKENGMLDIAFRSWADSHRHVIANNIITMDDGALCRRAMDIRGAEAVVTGNCIQGNNANERLKLTVTDGNVLITGNMFENVLVEIDDNTGKNKPIVVNNNILDNSMIEHKNGNLGDNSK